MKLGLVGCSAEALQLIQFIETQTAHRLVTGFALGSFTQAVTELCPGIEHHSDWETALTDDEIEGVIVAAADVSGRDDDVLRKLAGAGRPLLLVHPLCEAIVAYELNMIVQDSRAPITGWFPDLRPTVLHQLATSIAEHVSPTSQFGLGQLEPGQLEPGQLELGQVEQVIMDRSLPTTDRNVVLNQLARDAELLRLITGRFHSIQASAAHYHATELSNLSVVLTTDEGGPLVRWNLTTGPPRGSIKLLGFEQSWELTISEQKPWQWGPANAEPVDVEDAEFEDGCRAAIERFESQLGRGPGDQWLGLCRSLEVSDTVDVSLRKGRRIDLVEEAPTEEDSFKGVMAAWGCGILVLVLLIFLIGSIVDGFRVPTQVDAVGEVERAAAGDGPPPPANKGSLWWRLWPVYPLALFLILQTLVMVARGRRRSSSKKSEDE